MSGESERLTKGCPRCGEAPERIIYRNCGPIVYLVCPGCRFLLKEGLNAPAGGLFATWDELPRE